MKNQLEALVGIILLVIFLILAVYIIYTNWLSPHTTPANFINIDYKKERVFFLPELVFPTARTTTTTA
jgi:hypothetical protein